MTVKRIVLDIGTETISEVRAFYEDLFDLKPVMDQGWIITLGGDEMTPVQLSVASSGGSDMPVPDLSIQVTDIDEILERAEAMGVPIVYPLTEEPWGVERFMVNDPMGRLINIMTHV